MNDYGKRKCNGCRDLRAGRVWRGTRIWTCTRVQGINHNGRRCVLMENVFGENEPDILTPCWCRIGKKVSASADKDHPHPSAALTPSPSEGEGFEKGV